MTLKVEIANPVCERGVAVVLDDAGARQHFGGRPCQRVNGLTGGDGAVGHRALEHGVQRFIHHVAEREDSLARLCWRHGLHCSSNPRRQRSALHGPAVAMRPDRVDSGHGEH